MAKKHIAKSPEASKLAADEDTVFAPLVELRHRMDHLFDDFMHGWHMPSLRHDSWKVDPFADFPALSKLGGDLVDVKFDVSSNDAAVEITAEMPGMSEKDVELALSDGVLTVKGEKKTETEEEKKNYYSRERRFGSFTRSFRVPDSVDADKITASFDKGVLEVVLPKRPEAKAKTKKIAISKQS